jgi:cystine transport system substrate-binding protein
MVAYLVKTSPLPIRPGAVVGEADKNAIPLVKGNPALKAALNKALEDSYQDGSFKAVSVKWFGIDVSKPPAER